jgi:hypothetical protein
VVKLLGLAVQFISSTVSALPTTPFKVSVILGILACMIGTLESVITFFWMRGKYGADF